MSSRPFLGMRVRFNNMSPAHLGWRGMTGVVMSRHPDGGWNVRVEGQNKMFHHLGFSPEIAVPESWIGSVDDIPDTDEPAQPTPQNENLPYWQLRCVLDDAIAQASNGKGAERHATPPGERFEDQQIVRLGEWMGSNHFEIGQACKKAIESTRLPPDRARAELLGAINYLAAAVIVLERRKP